MGSSVHLPPGRSPAMPRPPTKRPSPPILPQGQSDRASGHGMALPVRGVLIFLLFTGLAAPFAGRAQTPKCMAVGDKLRCGLALSPPLQRPVTPAGPRVSPAPPFQLHAPAPAGLSDALKTIGGGLQRNAEQRRQAVFSLILSGRCGEAEASALKSGDADLASRVQSACAPRTP